jgi:hypothetical protein
MTSSCTARKFEFLIDPSALVLPAFAAAARAAAATASRERPLIPGTGRIFRSTENDVTLEVRIDQRPGETRDANVVEARHLGARDESLRGVLEVFCATIEGLPLREAADHGAIHALEKLRGDVLVTRPVSGILTPRSAGTAFVCCERLIRAILAQYSMETGARNTANFWNPALSAAWRAMSDPERVASLQPIIERFRTSHQLSEDDIWVAAIEKARRIVIGFGARVDYREKPMLLMHLELEIRKQTGDKLELFMSEAKDSNPIRRLASEDENS